MQPSISSPVPAAVSLSRSGMAGSFAAGGASAFVTFLSGTSLFGAAAVGTAILLAGLSTILFKAFRRAKSTLMQLDDAHHLYRQMAAIYPNGVILLYDRDVRFFVLEGWGAGDFGFSRDAVIGRTMAEIFLAEVWEPIAEHYTGVFQGHRSTFELRYRDRIRQAHTQPIYNHQGEIIAGMVVTYDITRQKQIEQSFQEQQERLIHLALHDPLTNLANRTLFNNQLEQAIRSARAGGSGVAVFFLDLDNFKPVNDSFGHEAGDRLLVQVGERISAMVPEGDTVARFGGDEFVILMKDVHSRIEVYARATEILNAIDEPFMVEGLPLTISASLGYSFSLDGDVTEAGELIRRADVAMYRAKSNGKHQLASMDGHEQGQLAFVLDHQD